MRRVVAITALFTLGLVGVSGQLASAATSGSSRIAPIVIRPIDPSATAQPVVATDNVMHALYELSLVNTRPAPVAIDRIEVRTVDPRLTIASYDGAVLASRLRHIDGSTLTEPVIAPGEQVFMFVDVGLYLTLALPMALDHRITIGDRQYNVAAITVDAVQAASLASPVNGSNWVVLEGCCGPRSVHRTTVYPTEAGYSVAGRFGMDLSQMDDLGRLVTGDPTQLTSYPSYNQYVNAVAPGRVVGVVDTFADQVPGALPPPGTFDEETSEGNSVVVELGNGQYAFYGQLRPGSIIVKSGTFVRKGQPIAQIGNSGNSSAPHLHFELLSNPDRISADGLPFVFTSFGYAGRIDSARFDFLGPAGPFAGSRLPVPQVRSLQLPLDLSILDFQSSSGSSGNPLL
ncbi:MAG: M23 family metallopeptidase [Acidimicrobiia bacterium]